MFSTWSYFFKNFMMRRIFTIVFTLLLIGSVHAQVSDAISFQGVARDGNGDCKANQTLSLQVSILDNINPENAVYAENHGPPTDDNGLFSIEIGRGFSTLNDFEDVDWTTKKWVKVVEGTTVLGTIELLTVPYAFYAKQAETAESADVADTAFVAGFADMANSANSALTAAQAGSAASANQAMQADTADFAFLTEQADNADFADTADFAAKTDTSNFAFKADSTNFASNGKVLSSYGTDSMTFLGSGGLPIVQIGGLLQLFDNFGEISVLDSLAEKRVRMWSNQGIGGAGTISTAGSNGTSNILIGGDTNNGNTGRIQVCRDGPTGPPSCPAPRRSSPGANRASRRPWTGCSLRAHVRSVRTRSACARRAARSPGRSRRPGPTRRRAPQPRRSRRARPRSACARSGCSGCTPRSCACVRSRAPRARRCRVSSDPLRRWARAPSRGSWRRSSRRCLAPACSWAACRRPRPPVRSGTTSRGSLPRRRRS